LNSQISQNDPVVIFQDFYILLVELFTGLLKSLLKGKEVARKRWLQNLILSLDLEALPLQLQNPTKAKVVNLLSQEQNQIIVLNRNHIPNRDLLLKEEVRNPIQGHH
jgi:hypothetical protein